MTDSPSVSPAQAPELSERVKRLARNFAAEWLRPSDPDSADPALLDTLQTTMVAFFACASRLRAPSRATPEEPLDEKTERQLREFLWLRHGHQGQYGDDGEMQCGYCVPAWDYRRAPLAEIVAQAIKAAHETQIAALMAASRATSAPEVEWSPSDPDPWVEKNKDRWVKEAAAVEAVRKHWEPQGEEPLVVGVHHTGSIARCQHPDCLSLKGATSAPQEPQPQEPEWEAPCTAFIRGGSGVAPDIYCRTCGFRKQDHPSPSAPKGKP